MEENSQKDNKDLKKFYIMVLLCGLMLSVPFYLLGVSITKNGCNAHYEPIMERLDECIIERNNEKNNSIKGLFTNLNLSEI